RFCSSRRLPHPCRLCSTVCRRRSSSRRSSSLSSVLSLHSSSRFGPRDTRSLPSTSTYTRRFAIRRLYLPLNAVPEWLSRKAVVRPAPRMEGIVGNGESGGSVRVPGRLLAPGNLTHGRGATGHPWAARPIPGAHVGADGISRRSRILVGGPLVVRGSK